MFRKVLAATDLVTVCDAAVITAAKIARQNQARLYILHVLESASVKNRHLIKDYKTGKGIAAGKAYTETVKKEINKVYQKALKLCSEFEIKITVGFPWIEILRWAQKEKTDLIVLGPHSQRAQAKGVVRTVGRFGSTLEAVLTRERCPTMIVNRLTPGAGVKFEKIMVSIDFSTSCQCALTFAIKIAQTFSAELFAFHMIPIPPYPKYSRRNYEVDVANLRSRLEAFGQGIPSEVKHQFQIWGGALPQIEILKCAEKNNIDLIVMGSHTKEKTGKWYPGSVVERVSCRAFCPVVVVTDPEALRPWEDDSALKIDQVNEIDRILRVFTQKKSF